MSPVRKIATLGTAAVVALTMSTASASATTPPQQTFPRVTEIDCGSGPVKVGATNALWAPLVDLRTGAKLKPVAWKVSGEGFSVDVAKTRVGEQVLACDYDDGEATGTVTVRTI